MPVAFDCTTLHHYLQLWCNHARRVSACPLLAIMNLNHHYTQLGSPSFYQTALGLHTSLKDQFGEKAPSYKQVKHFLDSKPSDYLQTPKQSARHKLVAGQSARWYHRNSPGLFFVDVAYLKKFVHFNWLVLIHLFQIRRAVQVLSHLRRRMFQVLLGAAAQSFKCSYLYRCFRQNSTRSSSKARENSTCGQRPWRRVYGRFSSTAPSTFNRSCVHSSRKFEQGLFCRKHDQEHSATTRSGNGRRPSQCVGQNQSCCVCSEQ